jgi:DUF4097 and DUF4098 domain-containing protein YvlB
LTLVVSPSVHGQRSTQQPGRSERETRTLAIGATGSLDLETIGGDIVVTRGNGQDTTVEIVKSARRGSDADAQQALKDVTVTVDVRGQRATVRANYPDRKLPSDVTVSYTVTAPAGTRVNAHTVGGDVKVSGIQGELTASTIGGGVTITDAARLVSANTVGGDISLTRANAEMTLKAETVGGNIRIQQAASRRLAANTVGGNITATEITSASVDIGTISGNVEFSGPIAKSGRYDLHTQSGTVRVMPTGGSGFELDARTFSGTISAGGSIQSQGSTGRGPSRELRTVIGDGSAVVNARTFSGDVVVGK